MKKLYLLFAECVLYGGALVRGQEVRMNGAMMKRKVLGHDFGARGRNIPIIYGVGEAVKLER